MTYAITLKSSYNSKLKALAKIAGCKEKDFIAKIIRDYIKDTDKIDAFDVKLAKKAKKSYIAVKAGKEKVYTFEEMRAKYDI